MQQHSGLLLRTLLLAAAAPLARAGVFAAGKVILRHSIPPDALAPAPAPASSPAPPQLRGCRISFTITNYDHADLAKTICSNETVHREKLETDSKLTEEAIKQKKNITNTTVNPLADAMGEVGDAISDFGESIGMKEQGDAIADSIDDMTDASEPGTVLLQHRGQLASAPAAAAPGPAPGPEPIVVVCESVETVLRRTVESTVQHVLAMPPASQGPAPAPVMLQASPLLRGAIPIPAALSPADAGEPKPEVDVFIRFRPGEVKKDANGKVIGRDVKVDVTLYGKSRNMINDMEELQPHLILTGAAESGAFEAELNKALYQATGLQPKLSPFKIEQKQIEQWSLQKCQAHFSRIVKLFSVAYTRGMVVDGLYNECTNFMTRLTFSDDLVIDDLDRNACRRATLEFGKAWKFGARKDHELPTEGEFHGFCQTACELKYGGHHPTCHVTEGENLINNP